MEEVDASTKKLLLQSAETLRRFAVALDSPALQGAEPLRGFAIPLDSPAQAVAYAGAFILRHPLSRCRSPGCTVAKGHRTRKADNAGCRARDVP